MYDDELKLFKEPPESYFNKSLERMFKVRNPMTNKLQDLNPIDRALFDMAKKTEPRGKPYYEESKDAVSKIDSFFKYIESTRKTIANK